MCLPAVEMAMCFCTLKRSNHSEVFFHKNEGNEKKLLLSKDNVFPVSTLKLLTAAGLLATFLLRTKRNRNDSKISMINYWKPSAQIFISFQLLSYSWSYSGKILKFHS